MAECIGPEADPHEPTDMDPVWTGTLNQYRCPECGTRVLVG